MGRVILAVTVAACVGLAGCGRRGALEPAPDPSVPAVAATDAGGDTAVQGFRRPKAAPITPPHEPFILDPLL